MAYDAYEHSHLAAAFTCFFLLSNIFNRFSSPNDEQIKYLNLGAQNTKLSHNNLQLYVLCIIEFSSTVPWCPGIFKCRHLWENFVIAVFSLVLCFFAILALNVEQQYIIWISKVFYLFAIIINHTISAIDVT